MKIFLIVFHSPLLSTREQTAAATFVHTGVPSQGEKEAPEDASLGGTGGFWGRLTNKYRAVPSSEETATLPKSLELKTNQAPRALAETNLDDEESGALHSSDTESADHNPAGATVTAPRRLFNNLMEKIQSLRTSTKVPSSEEEAKDVEAAELKATAAAGGDGVVYAELEIRKPGETPVIKESDDKTEYAQIVLPSSTAAKV